MTKMSRQKSGDALLLHNLPGSSTSVSSTSARVLRHGDFVRSLQRWMSAKNIPDNSPDDLGELDGPGEVGIVSELFLQPQNYFFPGLKRIPHQFQNPGHIALRKLNNIVVCSKSVPYRFLVISKFAKIGKSFPNISESDLEVPDIFEISKILKIREFAR